MGRKEPRWWMALAAAVIGVSLSASAAGATRWGADYFPDVALTTQDGKTVRFYQDLLKDKVVAIDLIYTHCKFSCPLETARLAQVHQGPIPLLHAMRRLPLGGRRWARR